MKKLKDIKLNLQTIIIFFLICISFHYSLKNFVIVNLNFISSNLAIRENFLQNNDIKFKGTHEPGRRYINLLYKNFDNLKNLNFTELQNTLNKINKTKIHEKNYLMEYQLIEILKKLSKISSSEKTNTAIHISSNLNDFWELSCDRFMTPFLVPAITNMVLIKGLPDNKMKSCYGHKEEYGYARYKAFNKKTLTKKLSSKELCKYASKENLNNVIEILKIDNNYSYKKYKC